jgi:hypothetical protein
VGLERGVTQVAQHLPSKYKALVQSPVMQKLKKELYEFIYTILYIYTYTYIHIYMILRNMADT